MRLVLLTNFVPPYRVPVFRALRDRAGALRVLVSTPMEANRPWTPAWSDLDVVVQRTWTLHRNWQHERFSEPYELHVPYDTFARLREWRPDAVVSAEFGARSLQAIGYARVARVPVIIWATVVDHLERSRGVVRAAARRLMVRGADRIIVNGEGGARYIRSLGYAEARIARIPQAIDLTPFTNLSLEREGEAARRLLYVGSLSERKGVEVLLHGAALWARQHPDRRLSLTIVGDGPERSRLARIELPMNVAVQWVGAVEYAELPRWYERAGIGVFPTRGDEWGLVVNEAMAAGLPVIGSAYAQAVEELVRDGRNGWCFRPDDAGSVADALDRALATPDGVLSEMRCEARATATAITPESVAERIVALVHEVAR